MDKVSSALSQKQAGVSPSSLKRSATPPQSARGDEVGEGTGAQRLGRALQRHRLSLLAMAAVMDGMRALPQRLSRRASSSHWSERNLTDHASLGTSSNNKSVSDNTVAHTPRSDTVAVRRTSMPPPPPTTGGGAMELQPVEVQRKTKVDKRRDGMRSRAARLLPWAKRKRQPHPNSTEC